MSSSVPQVRSQSPKSRNHGRPERSVSVGQDVLIDLDIRVSEIIEAAALTAQAARGLVTRTHADSAVMVAAARIAKAHRALIDDANARLGRTA
jgi:hypothetical protein